MSEPLVVLDGVEKRFDDFVAVRRADLTINAGEFVAIMGPSGCGKTTTLRMLAGLEDPSAGTIHIDGKVMNGVPPHERDTPMVWQTLALFPFLNVRENVEFGLKMRGVAAPERGRRAKDWLERMEIGEFAGRNIETLSGGQKQRVALARALVTEPRLLLLDEPLSALDAHLVIRMQSVLTRLQRELGITFVYVTHSQSEAFAMADRIVIMASGEVAQVGGAREIYRNPANRFVAEFVGRNTILTGSVEGARLKTALGSFTMPGQGTQPADGTQANLVIAADRLQIGRGPLEVENTLRATLISEEFVGAFVTLFLEAEDGTEFKVQLQESALGALDLSSGGTFHLGWRGEQAHLMIEDAR